MSHPKSRRRQLLRAAVHLPAFALAPHCPALAQPRTESAAPRQRLALLVGNGDYPNGEDLPPVRKNVSDVERALRELGFAVDVHLDVGPSEFRQAIGEFAARVAAIAQAPFVLFYFCGHGVESMGDNLLLPARIPDTAPAAVLRRDAVNLQKEVLARLPQV
jgi:uncharacterized caspase-like protein